MGPRSAEVILIFCDSLTGSRDFLKCIDFNYAETFCAMAGERTEYSLLLLHKYYSICLYVGSIFSVS